MASDKLDVIIFGASGFSKWRITDFSFGKCGKCVVK